MANIPRGRGKVKFFLWQVVLFSSQIFSFLRQDKIGLVEYAICPKSRNARPVAAMIGDCGYRLVGSVADSFGGGLSPCRAFLEAFALLRLGISCPTPLAASQRPGRDP